MIQVDIIGLRNLRGHFASMLDHELVAIQFEEATAMADVIEQIFRRRAPRGEKISTKTGQHFYEGIKAQATAEGFGFSIEVDTDNPDLRRWLAEGTGVYAGHGRIYSSTGGPLGPIGSWSKGGGSGPYFFHSIAGMRPNPWEKDADDEAAPFAQELGRRIGQRVVVALAL